MANEHESTVGPPRRPLVISRTFTASKERVFAAWSTADHLKRWFCPAAYTVPEAQVEFSDWWRLRHLHAFA